MGRAAATASRGFGRLPATPRPTSRARSQSSLFEQFDLEIVNRRRFGKQQRGKLRRTKRRQWGPSYQLVVKFMPPEAKHIRPFRLVDRIRHLEPPVSYASH